MIRPFKNTLSKTIISDWNANGITGYEPIKLGYRGWFDAFSSLLWDKWD